MSDPKNDEGDEDTQLWWRALKTLLANGATAAEAFEGANLVLAAHRRNAGAVSVEAKGSRATRRRSGTGEPGSK